MTVAPRCSARSIMCTTICRPSPLPLLVAAHAHVQQMCLVGADRQYAVSNEDRVALRDPTFVPRLQTVAEHAARPRKRIAARLVLDDAIEIVRLHRPEAQARMRVRYAEPQLSVSIRIGAQRAAVWQSQRLNGRAAWAVAGIEQSLSRSRRATAASARSARSIWPRRNPRYALRAAATLASPVCVCGQRNCAAAAARRGAGDGEHDVLRQLAVERRRALADDDDAGGCDAIEADLQFDRARRCVGGGLLRSGDRTIAAARPVRIRGASGGVAATARRDGDRAHRVAPRRRSPCRPARAVADPSVRSMRCSCAHSTEACRQS